MILEAKDISVSLGGASILRGIDLDVGDNQWLVIIGPNGAGKTTLLNCIVKGVTYTGLIKLSGADIKTLKPRELARRVGFLAQMKFMDYSFTVEEIVRLGRYAHEKRGIFEFGAQNTESQATVDDALRLTGLTHLKNSSALTLSGGELQRMFLAQVLAQAPNLLLLDELSNHLDLIYQKRIFSLVREWVRSPGRAVISVSHDLGVAKYYADDAILLNRGELIARGMGDVFDAKTLSLAYGMDVRAWIKKLYETWV
ncbi:MAG: ABC transporter ATP-binding protein [Clostridiales bacterium]|jgi:iron complex transport system ATP-binding protein|nr:ABC transporter ATP-binding protein [Clostridiales bacterium]